MSESPAPRPDPMRVVERLAEQAAAERGSGEAMDDTARLVLYARTAPDVIGARQLGAAERGSFSVWFDNLRGRGPWWGAPLPGSSRMLAWDDAGQLHVSEGATAGDRRAALAGGIALALAMIAFARVMGGRAILPAIVLGVASAMIAKHSAAGWHRFGSRAEDRKLEGRVGELVRRYEET
ncbi:MAG TPA: hypothetical protein VFN90_03815 [Gemmatimonadales bacterium]|nr:hypothetical protein [Gemmatimonadales bacterium]